MPKPVQFKVTKCGLKQTNHIQQKIFVSRGLRVILDSDPAKLYGVTSFQQLFTAIRGLMALPDKSRRTIGFLAGSKRRRKERP